jgi:hypothetical protein
VHLYTYFYNFLRSSQQILPLLPFLSLPSKSCAKDTLIVSTDDSMFHTFQTAVAVKSPEGEGSEAMGKPTRPAGSRRISTSNACVECRRRKIRCDGTQPCGQCQWYQHPELCNYSKPAQRIVPSRKFVPLVFVAANFRY